MRKNIEKKICPLHRPLPLLIEIQSESHGFVVIVMNFHLATTAEIKIYLPSGYVPYSRAHKPSAYKYEFGDFWGCAYN